MQDSELRPELERIFTTVRDAFQHYELDKARPYLDIPPDEPLPDRGAAQQLAAFLPDLAKCRFVKLAREGAWAGYYLRAPDEDGHPSVAVIRFREHPDGWRLAPPPHSISGYSGDPTDDAGVLAWFEEQACLALVPEGVDPSADSPDAPAPAAPSAPAAPEGTDTRPESEVKAEMEAGWKALRAAFAEGAVEQALAYVEIPEEMGLPSPEEARGFLRDAPDLERCRFLKLMFSAARPGTAAYFAAGEPRRPNESVIERILFTYKDGRWKFAAGRDCLEQKTVEKTTDEELLRIVETNSALWI